MDNSGLLTIIIVLLLGIFTALFVEMNGKGYTAERVTAGDANLLSRDVGNVIDKSYHEG